MLGVARLGDLCTGHGNFKTRPCTQGSPDTFANGRKRHRRTDVWVTHTSGDNSHSSQLSTASRTVFVNGLGQGRIGDLVACTSRVKTGSEDVFAG